MTYDKEYADVLPWEQQVTHSGKKYEELDLPEDPNALTSDDAEWKMLQKNIFTRWANEHLKQVNQFVYNIETDFEDGVKLNALVQVLACLKDEYISEKIKMPKKARFRPQMLDNIQMVLNYVGKEGIPLVNVNANDINKGNMKIILGLMWQLILKYQVTASHYNLPDMEDADWKNLTPKQALMKWVKSKLPADMEMNNFSSDWNNGIALAALTEGVQPGAFPDWKELSKDKPLENAYRAMEAAEKHLGVPKVITPEEISFVRVDEFSVMTYVSYFPDALINLRAAQLRAKTEVPAPPKPEYNEAQLGRRALHPPPKEDDW
jgi:filamin